MRIIGGKFKGRRFSPPADNWPTRPTTDFAKEGLFNIINNRMDFEDLKVLDLFGGTGSHGYEFVSRGCNDVTYVDKFAGAVKFVRETVKALKIESEMKIYQMDVFKYMETSKEKFTYIFAGPPYPLPTLDTIPDKIFEHGLLAEDGVFVLEHNPNHRFKNHPKFVEARNYGTTIFSFFENNPVRETAETEEETE
jgi:16S rRNA (guanine966-N2)-methyltransferase